MEMLRSVLVGTDTGAQAVTSADTIERLVDRVTSSTLLEDRRDACRALKAMSKKFRLEVGAQGLNPLIQVLKTDQSDWEIISYVLETLSNIFYPEEFEEEVISEKQKEDFTGVGEGFSEMFLKSGDNLPLLLDFLEEFDFKIRRPAVAALNYLLSNCPRDVQQQILNSHTGVSKLMDILGETREVLRNDALILLFKLTKGNSNIQKIVAFENAFDKLMEIMEFEGWTDGGIVVEDCLRLMLNLLRNNPSNQIFFKEGSYISRLLPAIDITDGTEEYGWDAQKVSNMLHILQLIRTLVAPSNPGHITSACQLACKQGDVLEQLEEILLASGIPADVLTEAINTIAELIRGNNENQAQFINVAAPSDPPRPILVLLLMSMVNEKQPFSLRCSVLYCVQSFLCRNPRGQTMIVDQLLPKEEILGPVDITAGQLLCGGLFSNDPVSNWLCSVALAQVFSESPKLKEELLRVQLATQGGTAPVPLLAQCMFLLHHNATLQTRLGLLQLICVWVESCPAAVTCLLQMEGSLAFFMTQICSNEHDETERLGHGLCAFLLGLCIIYNNNSVTGSTQEELITLVEKRVGTDQFLDKIADIPKHESFNKALKSPQLRCSNINELIVDNLFCQLFRSHDRDITNMIANRKSSPVMMNGHAMDESTHAAMQNYKAFIREQDGKMKQYIEANQLMHTQYKNLQTQYEELSGTVHLLRDQNAILQAQAMNAVTSSRQPSQSLSSDSLNLQSEVETLKKQISQQDEYIQELEARLTADEGRNASNLSNEGGDASILSIQPNQEKLYTATQNSESQTVVDAVASEAAIEAASISVDLLQKQAETIKTFKFKLESTRSMLMKKDEEIIELKNRLPLDSSTERFDDMFKTTLELESSRKGNGVNSFELELKEKEIVRLHGVHEEELHNITKERNTIEIDLYKARHELDEMREIMGETSRDKVDGLERRLRETTAELEELREQRDTKVVAVSSQMELQNNSLLSLNEQLRERGDTIEGLRSEQEDLLVMLSDQEEKMAKYKGLLKGLNVAVSEDEDEDEDDVDLS